MPRAEWFEHPALAGLCGCRTSSQGAIDIAESRLRGSLARNEDEELCYYPAEWFDLTWAAVASYDGLRVHLCVTSPGVITADTLAPADATDLALASELLAGQRG